MACQTRESDLSDFFSHENYSYLSALSKFGKLNHTNKSNTISILETLEPRQHNVPKFDTIIFDGACSCSTKCFLQIHLRPFLLHKINKVKCADIVFDIYRDRSIKLQKQEDLEDG